MPEPPNVSPVRGMRDLLPAECELRDWAVGRILDTYRRFGFARIETPVLEHLALLTGGQGGENEKLIYRVMRRAESFQKGQVSVLDHVMARTASLAAELAKGVGPAAPGPTQGAYPDDVDNEELRQFVLRLFDKYQDPSHPDVAAFNRWMHGVEPRAKTFHDLSLKFAAFREAEDELSEEGLRFDLTVPLARYYASNQGVLPQPFKAIQIGSVFRAERPQKGRFRQFTQCDIDVLGEAGELAEVELILATTEALASLGLSGFTVRINDRRILDAFVAQYIESHETRAKVFVAIDKLDKVGWPGVATELVALGSPPALVDSLERHFAPAKPPEVATPIGAFVGLLDAVVPMMLDDNHPMAAARVHAHGLKRIEEALAGPLAARSVSLVFDFSLVRGMGYYTGPIFEISMEGAPGSIAGGGRYDRMIGRMLGREVPACGFSIGFERVIGLLMERGVQAPKSATRFALLHEPGVDALPRVMAEAAARRDGGNTVAVFAKRKKLGKQLDELERAGFDCVLTLPAGNGPPEEKWLGARGAAGG